MRSLLRWFSILFILLLLIPTVFAREVFQQRDCLVKADEVIEGDLFVLCRELRIYGDVNGDVIGAAPLVVIDGRVDGSIYLIAGQFDLRGNVTKDVHFAGTVMRVNPQLESGEERTPARRQRIGAINAISITLSIFENTRVADGIKNLGYQLLLHGDVGGEVSFLGSSLIVDSTLGGNVYAKVGDPAAESGQIETLLLPLQWVPLDFAEVELTNPGLVITHESLIQGSLVYSGPVEGNIQGTVEGNTVFRQSNGVVLPTLEEPGSFSIFFVDLLREFVTLVAIGAFSLLVVPHLIKSPLVSLRSRPFASFSVGMLAFLLSFPIVLLVVLLSFALLFTLQLIGLSSVIVALGIVLALVNLGGVSIFYFVAIFVARVLTSLILGSLIMSGRFSQWYGIRWELVRLAAGVFVLSVLVSIPYVGIFVNAAASFIGLGAILSVLLNNLRHLRETQRSLNPIWHSSPPSLPAQSPSGIQRHVDQLNPPSPPPAPVEPSSQPTYNKTEHDGESPGMDDLPEGFDMSFFEDD